MIAYLLGALGCLLAVITTGVRTLRRRIAVVAVSGPSMQPTLNSGDRVLIRRASIGQLQTGQIVVVEKPRANQAASMALPRWPPAQHGWMIKRVAAAAGEPAPAVMLTESAQPAEPVVPAGKLAVLGDNLGCSLDSRHIGYIPAERVLGIMIRSLPRWRSAECAQPGARAARGPEPGTMRSPAASNSSSRVAK